MLRAAAALLVLSVVAAASPAAASSSPMLSADPAVLWPPDHRLVGVTVSIRGTEACEAPSALLRGYWSTEPDDAPGGSDGRTSNDVQSMEPGGDFRILIRAERDARGSGRAYGLRYEVTCADGSRMEESVEVIVPHDQGGAVDPVSMSLAGSPGGTVITWGPVPGADWYRVVRGDVAGLRWDDSAVHLGALDCIALDGRQAIDDHAPPPGVAFFYLVGYHDGVSLILGSESAVGPRLAPAGGCTRIIRR